MPRMLARPSLSGKENSTLLSRRPGRSNAGSSVSGLANGFSLVGNQGQMSYLFVAMRTLMLPLGSNPSSWLMSSNMVLCTSLSPPAPSSNRAPPTASISSKKMMHAFFVLAISNNSRTILAPSPTYFCTNSDPITLMNVASVLLATALAHRVFPVPGGPKRRTPFGGSIPRFTNRSGCKDNVRNQHAKSWRKGSLHEGEALPQLLEAFLLALYSRLHRHR